MYHLLVNYNGWQSSRDSLNNSRVFEYTSDSMISLFKPVGNLDMSGVTRIPALFATETGGTGIQLARVGYINKTETSGNDVYIEYHFDPDIPSIPNLMLEQMSVELGIEGYELSRTHWAVKDIDLFRFFLKHQLFAKLSPKVFSLENSIVIEEDLISVMMPFARDFDNVYDLLQQTAKELKLRCLRADDIWENDAVIQDVVSLIHRSRIVICDCTGRNANVFYEVGIAHTLGKDVILITQSTNDIPFDLRHLRYLNYLNNNEGRETLSGNLTKRIRSIIA